MTREEWIAYAKELGFEEAAPIDPQTLTPNAEVRAMCAADKCHAYGKNWTCPPECGDLDTCTRRIREKTWGVLVQSVAQLEDSFDIEGMMELEENHNRRFHALADRAHEMQKTALCLGTGGCRICGKGNCAYPAPCRFPDRACASMEGYGLLVSDACTAAGIPYYHGPNTLAYTACVLMGNG